MWGSSRGPRHARGVAGKHAVNTTTKLLRPRLLRIGVGRPIERRHQISRELRALFDGQIKCIVQQLCSGSACGHAHYDNRSAIDRNLAQRHGVGGCGEVLGGSPTACSGSCSIVLGGGARGVCLSPARDLAREPCARLAPSRCRPWAAIEGAGLAMGAGWESDWVARARCARGQLERTRGCVVASVHENRDRSPPRDGRERRRARRASCFCRF